MHTDQRAESLAKASDAFVAAVHAGTSMSDLARAVGIQKASRYHHFPSKESLFVACVTEGYDGAARKLKAIHADPTLGAPTRTRAAI